MYVWVVSYYQTQHSKPPSAHIDLLVEKALLEVLVDRLVSDRAEQSHVRHTGLLLLLEPLGPVGLLVSFPNFEDKRQDLAHLGDLRFRASSTSSTAQQTADTLLACFLGWCLWVSGEFIASIDTQQPC